MSNIFVVGFAPLPFENKNKIYAYNFRTWHFIKAFLDGGNKVCAICLRIHGTYEHNAKGIIVFNNNDFRYYSMSENNFRNTDLIKNIYRKFNPDCILGISAYSSIVFSKLIDRKPIWVDLMGFMMTEAQTKAFVFQDDSYLEHFWDYEKLTICNADKFSVVSQPSLYALIGELGTVGRLNKYTYGYDFVCYIPIGTESNEYVHTKRVIRGKIVGEDDFVILWSGGYNTWTDIDTLFFAIEQAMEENGKIKFVSLGGEIEGHDELTFHRFRERIKKSKFKDRYCFIGWVPLEDVPNYYFESDIGINIDSFNYETLLGSRCRIIDMFKGGLPVLCSRGTELSHIIENNNLGFVFPIGDCKYLKSAIIKLANDREILRDYGLRAKNYIFKNFDINRILKPVLDWSKNPCYAPDKKYIVNRLCLYNRKTVEDPWYSKRNLNPLFNKFKTCLRECGFTFTLLKIIKFIKYRIKKIY